jgi:glycerol kinase
MAHAGLAAPESVKVDGGMARNNAFCQRLADLTGCTVARPAVTETTALGAAALAALSSGVYRDLSEVAAAWSLDRAFSPRLDLATRNSLYSGWQDAVSRVRS